ncbi:MAG: nucleotidyl transferase AbiEii/AbiGii toxin family protein [Candidatus Aminicenantaceae bacterium]
MFQKLIKRIASELQRVKIPYMIIGGQAVLIYGEPRLTKDIDITLGINVDELDKLKEVIHTVNLTVLVNNPEKFAKDTMVLPTLDDESKIRVDFIFSFSLYENEALKRTNNIKIKGKTVRFASLEDVIIHKIISGRARDLEDIRIIILKNPVYDKSYIEKWLGEFDHSLSKKFTQLFHKIISEL